MILFNSKAGPMRRERYDPSLSMKTEKLEVEARSRPWTPPPMNISSPSRHSVASDLSSISSMPLPASVPFVPAFVIDQTRWEMMQKQVSDHECKIEVLAQTYKRHALELKILTQKLNLLKETTELALPPIDTTPKPEKWRWCSFGQVFATFCLAASTLLVWLNTAAPVLGAEYYYT